MATDMLWTPKDKSKLHLVQLAPNGRPLPLDKGLDLTTAWGMRLVEELHIVKPGWQEHLGGGKDAHAAWFAIEKRYSELREEDPATIARRLEEAEFQRYVNRCIPEKPDRGGDWDYDNRW